MSVENLTCIPLKNIQNARLNLHSVKKSPLLPLNFDWPDGKIYLKLENLHPIGSFKVRGALNAIKSLSPEKLKRGVYTASAGNFAQGLALAAKEVGVPCTAIVPDTAPVAKVKAIERLGASVVRVSYGAWWDVITTHAYAGMDATFIHPVANADVIAGTNIITPALFNNNY
ncbi:hypothetical protein ScPMuIL_004568 [Solemya velum]